MVKKGEPNIPDNIGNSFDSARSDFSLQMICEGMSGQQISEPITLSCHSSHEQKQNQAHLTIPSGEHTIPPDGLSIPGIETEITQGIQLTIGGQHKEVGNYDPSIINPEKQFATQENAKIRELTQRVKKARSFYELSNIIISAHKERIIGKLKYLVGNKIDFQRIRYETPPDEKRTTYKALRILKESVKAKSKELAALTIKRRKKHKNLPPRRRSKR